MMTEAEAQQWLWERVCYFSAKCSQQGRYQAQWQQLRERALKRLRAQMELLESDS